MRNTLLLILLLLVLSCNKQKKIQGIWLSSYSLNEKGIKTPIAAKKMIEFIDDSLHIRGVKTFPYSRYDGKYALNRSLLEINDSIFINIKEISKNTLVFINDNQEKIIYNKLTDSLKSQCQSYKFDNKIFRIEYPNIIDTITFINDSILINQSYRIERNWSLIKYKGFVILMTDDVLDLPLILRQSNDNSIDLIVFDSIPKSIIMVELFN